MVKNKIAFALGILLGTQAVPGLLSLAGYKDILNAGSTGVMAYVVLTALFALVFARLFKWLFVSRS